MARRSKRPPRVEAHPARRAAFARGLSAESRAALLLIAKGYRIAARRWKSPVGEIDIVARRCNLLVFVEVKARVGLDEAAFAVTPHQRRRILAAARAWLARHPGDVACAMRFDAILVAPWRMPRHVVGAFDESG
jgi:putative endonuclease